MTVGSFMPLPAGGDPYWASVALLALNENGADESTVFDDASTYNHTLTPSGNAKWDTAQAPTGLTSCLACDGNGDSVDSADHAILDLGGSDFTIECTFRTVDTTNIGVIGKYNSDFTFGWQFYIDFSGNLDWLASSDGDIYDISDVSEHLMGAIADDTWYHAAVTRSGNTWKGFLNGVQGFSFSNSLSLRATDLGINMGVCLSGGHFNGWLASVRITNGVARYTANFTPPTLPLPTS